MNNNFILCNVVINNRFNLDKIKTWKIGVSVESVHRKILIDSMYVRDIKIMVAYKIFKACFNYRKNFS